ncbi:MAG: hypothetical protein ACR2IK_02240, partial [Chloroflexota bacterium]
RGFRTALSASSASPGLRGSGGSEDGRAGPRLGGPGLAPIVCRRDDYAFLPAGASAGLPCGSTSTRTTADPRQVAQGLFDQLEMPWLRIDMNPRLGMVAVPTWFWVEGYDGGVIPLTNTLVLTHEECRTVSESDANGRPALDADGTPRTRRDCQTISDTLSVDVRVWPRTFAWSFGDSASRLITCSDAAACPAGIGQPFTDPRSASPIAHAYRWSSLGKNGDADTYTVGLNISFGAQYRFSTNGDSLSLAVTREPHPRLERQSPGPGGADGAYSTLDWPIESGTPG